VLGDSGQVRTETGKKGMNLETDDAYSLRFSRLEQERFPRKAVYPVATRDSESPNTKYNYLSGGRTCGSESSQSL
jgi:hypothetical protein